MTRPMRIGILAVLNCLYWAIVFALDWYGVIPERFIAPLCWLSILLSLPLAPCFSIWLLINGQFHETGWRLVLSAGITFLNCFVWAWCADWLWRRLRKKSEPRGFEV